MTKGELLYSCLLQVRPMQFWEWRPGAESPSRGQEPRTPWANLTERSQWTCEDWERIARMYLHTSLIPGREGEALYECVLQVSPTQRREFSNSAIPRPQWKDMQHKHPVVHPRSKAEQWSEIARLFLDRVREAA